MMINDSTATMMINDSTATTMMMEQGTNKRRNKAPIMYNN
jgi:hypothetical protein